jgi:hypothetical protein
MEALKRALCLTRFTVLSLTSRRRWWALLVLVGSCRGTDLVAPPLTPVPEVSAEVSANPHNILSAVFSVATERAESARVVF